MNHLIICLFYILLSLRILFGKLGQWINQTLSVNFFFIVYSDGTKVKQIHSCFNHHHSFKTCLNYLLQSRMEHIDKVNTDFVTGILPIISVEHLIERPHHMYTILTI